MGAIWAWESWAEVWASRVKRARMAGSWARSGGRTLIATGRLSRRSRARYTTDMPPRPISVVFITLYNLSVIALSIWTVEAMLIRNETETTRVLEDEWTLGQISAMILLATPMFTFAKILKSRFLPSRSVGGDELERTETQLDVNGKDNWYVPIAFVYEQLHVTF